MLASSLPVIIAGQAADRFGLATVTTWYLVTVAGVVAIALRLSRKRPITTIERGDRRVATTG